MKVPLVIRARSLLYSLARPLRSLITGIVIMLRAFFMRFYHIPAGCISGNRIIPQTGVGHNSLQAGGSPGSGITFIPFCKVSGESEKHTYLY